MRTQDAFQKMFRKKGLKYSAEQESGADRDGNANKLLQQTGETLRGSTQMADDLQADSLMQSSNGREHFYSELW